MLKFDLVKYSCFGIMW